MLARPGVFGGGSPYGRWSLVQIVRGTSDVAVGERCPDCSLRRRRSSLDLRSCSSSFASVSGLSADVPALVRERA
jgi:hypothetical protein